MDILFAEQTEGTVARLHKWLVKPGDAIKADQPVAELETDKVTLEIAAPADGFLSEVLVQTDAEVTPGTVLGRLSNEPPATVEQLVDILFPADHSEGTVATLSHWLVKPGERVIEGAPLAEVETDKVALEITAPASGILHTVTVAPGEPLNPGQLMGAVAVRGLPAAATPVARSDGRNNERLSPAVRQLMTRYHIDSLRMIPGTGVGGRVTRDDLLAWLEQRAPTEGTPTSQRVPHSAMRRAIARNMMDSIRKAPHVTSLFEADMSLVAAHRNAHKDEFARQGVKLTYTAYFLAAAARAMADVPQVNGRYHQDHLEVFDEVNIGVGTALGDDGLIVPVVRQVDQLDLLGIARDLQDKTERARTGLLKSTDLAGGTFTISNHGVSGSLLAAPIIINQPQVAILGIGKLEKRVAVETVNGEDSICVIPKCYVTLSIDHRALDAFQTNHWLASFVRALEQWPQQDSTRAD